MKFKTMEKTPREILAISAYHIRRSSLVHNFNHIAPHRAILPAPFSVEASAP
jgi:hypothetical protein